MVDTTAGGAAPNLHRLSRRGTKPGPDGRQVTAAQPPEMARKDTTAPKRRCADLLGKSRRHRLRFRLAVRGPRAHRTLVPRPAPTAGPRSGTRQRRGVDRSLDRRPGDDLVPGRKRGRVL